MLRTPDFNRSEKFKVVHFHCWVDLPHPLSLILHYGM